MDRRSHVREHAVAAALVALGFTSCGSPPPAAIDAATPAPTPASAFNMTLYAHLDLAALTSVVHDHQLRAEPQRRNESQAASGARFIRAELGRQGGAPQRPLAQHDEPIQVEGATSVAGNWGYTSPDGRRFALTGTSTGLSIVEVTDPRRPRTVALVEGPANQWREVRTYGSYAYVSTEAKHGIDIVDLSDPDHPRKVQTWNRTLSSAHTVTVDDERGLLYVNGADGRTGGMHVLDVGADPEDPPEVGAFHDYYVHDAYARGTVLFVSAMYEGFEALLDVSNPARIREITRFFTGGRFPHNSWLTRDGRYLFTTDERPGSPLEGWDIVDPLAPRKVSQYIGAPGTIPHNVMIDGDRMVVSHYTEGVHLLDVSDPERPRLLGWYDTYTGTATGFSGAWGAYIFPGADLIVVSDINGGLFVVGYTPR